MHALHPLLRVAGAAMFGCALAGAAVAERPVPGFDPQLHVRPPTMKRLDGSSGALQVDATFREEAARLRAQQPRLLPARGDLARRGEVLVLQGDDETLETNGSGFGVRSLSAAVRRVIEHAGDHFHTITFWLTFRDQASPGAVAYAANIRNEIAGLGPTMPLRDLTRQYGSQGVLRTVVNMKQVGLAAGDSPTSWAPHLATWGQESGHRWMAFMQVRDPRSGRNSDVLLGRDCAHYSRFVDTQASVHDGFAWRDNGNGTFTVTGEAQRYGYLDLYGMGLLPADEMPSFFFIDGIPGFSHPGCGQPYDRAGKPGATLIGGTRVDVTAADIVAANGPRVPAAEDGREDYWREAQVVLTTPNETVDSPTPRALADRIDRARLFWEAWNLQATGNRLVICTKTSGDCGDARSDVRQVRFEPPVGGPRKGAGTAVIELHNDGARPATGVRAAVTVAGGGREPRVLTRDVGTLAPGETRVERFPVDLAGLSCGTELAIKASTTSDFHQHRRRAEIVFGTEVKVTEGFETDSGWTLDPDGDDTSSGAVWERGRPEPTSLLRQDVQPDGAYAGEGAWVTGLAATPGDRDATFVRGGKTTLQSPVYDAAGLTDARLRFWVSFAGLRADPTGDGVEPSPDSRMIVYARTGSMDGSGQPGPWVEIHRIENKITAGWVQRTAMLPVELLAQGGVQLRFVAVDGNPAQGGVEVAIDDLEILSTMAGCDEPDPSSSDGGCACDVGGARQPGWFTLLAAPWLVLVGRRRRRRV